MCDSRRSGRSRKAVDYAKFGGEEDFADDDDDFSGLTPPPGKKPKIAKESKPKEISQKKDKKKKEVEGVSRLSRDEKNYDRELKLALEMSKAEVYECEPESIANQKNKTEEGKHEQIDKDRSKGSPNVPIKNSEKTRSKKHDEVDMEDLDTIEVLEEDVQEGELGKGGRTKKKKVPTATLR